jgi:hypothetical protein
MKCWHCKAEFTRDHALRVAENKFGLHWENWAGWRFSGRFLIAPGKAGRITPERLLGLLWEEQARAGMRRPCTQRAQVVRLAARERFDGQA